MLEGEEGEEGEGRGGGEGGEDQHRNYKERAASSKPWGAPLPPHMAFNTTSSRRK